jgi:hypothetical protein
MIFELYFFRILNKGGSTKHAENGVKEMSRPSDLANKTPDPGRSLGAFLQKSGTMYLDWHCIAHSNFIAV